MMANQIHSSGSLGLESIRVLSSSKLSAIAHDLECARAVADHF
jgi:hypothetical protein